MARTEEQQIEEDFKVASKTAQSMVKSSTKEDVGKMLGELKMVKTRLVGLTRDLPERYKPLKQVLPHVESLGNGISDINHWVDGGNQLLESHKIGRGNINQVEEKLDRHKVCC